MTSNIPQNQDEHFGRECIALELVALQSIFSNFYNMFGVYMIRKCLLIILFSLCSCSTLDAEEKTDQLQLQESLQRFYTRFTERTLESFLDAGLDQNIQTREMAVRQYTLYDSEALKIATGPYPEVNLLDMLVFIKLNKMTIQSYWVPKWKDSGNLILNSFIESEKDIERIATTVLNAQQMDKINVGVVDWKKKNSQIYRVEKIRLDEVAKAIPQLGIDANKESGFLNIKGAVKAVDQMVLVANRGIFVAQYMPMLLRLQTRIATTEIIDDVSMRFSHQNLGKKVNRSIASINGMAPMLDSAVNLTSDMKNITEDTHKLLNSYHRIFPKGINATENLKTIQTIVAGTNTLFEDMKNSKGLNQNVLVDMKIQLKSMAVYIAALVLGVGMLLSAFFWGCYYIVSKAKLKQMREVL
jgi:hypothetical protein